MTNSDFLPTEREITFIQAKRVARLATADSFGRPRVIPICYVYNGKYIYTPIDKKPKRVSVRRLKRIQNIKDNPNVSIVIDEYHEDWSRLCYVIIHGTASLMYSGSEYLESLNMLSEKYLQYQEMNLLDLKLPVIKVYPNRIISWGRI